MTGRIAPLAVIIALLAGCSADPGVPASSSATSAASPAADATPPLEWFTDQAAASGLDVVHFNGATGRLYYPEILPPGVALFDYDNDGDLDAYIVQSRALGPGPAPEPPARALPLRGRLYRNDLSIGADGARRLHFTDVTLQSGIDAHGFGIGVAAGDIDNDGWVDLYLTNFGPSQMLHNNGDGTFTDVTAASGTENPAGFGVSAAFLDYDRDGWLDLYVGNNVNYRLDNEKVCPNTAGVPDYCPPQIYGGRPDRLYHNLGRGRFSDVTAKALAGARVAPALGVSTADFNGDGWIDLFVANDGEDNQLWLNQRNGTFKETALLAGVALTAEGKAEASMGVDAGDFDNDGDDDLIMTELTGQGSNVYLNDGRANFRDASAASGLSAATLPFTGWGTTWFDFDDDGWLDALAVNGTIVASEGRAGRTFPYDQRKLLLRNLGNGRFEDVTSRAGAVFGLSEAGRGAAFGDVDNDGDIDVLVGNDAGPVRLLVNNIGNRKHWLGVNLTGYSSSSDSGPAGRKTAVESAPGPSRAPGEGRPVLGARIGITRSSGPTLWRRARSDGSYASANDPRVLVGLGDSTERPRVQVQWPDGRSEEWPEVSIDQWTTLKMGSGK
jgi:hypothetical protein